MKTDQSYLNEALLIAGVVFFIIGCYFAAISQHVEPISLITGG